MKQFEEGVKHRCTLHFVHITLGTPTQFGLLQRPLFSVNVGQCPVSSLLISWTGTAAAFGFFFFFTSIFNCTCDRLGLPLFWFLFSLDGTNMLQSQPWTVEDSTDLFALSLTVHSLSYTKDHFLDLIFILYSAISESIRSTPPMNLLYIMIALGHWTW